MTAENFASMADNIGKLGVPIMITALILIFVVIYVPKWMEVVISNKKAKMEAELAQSAKEAELTRRSKEAELVQRAKDSEYQAARQEMYDKQMSMMISAMDQSNNVIERSNNVIERSNILFEQTNESFKGNQRVIESVTKHIDDNTAAMKELRDELRSHDKESAHRNNSVLLAIKDVS